MREIKFRVWNKEQKKMINSIDCEEFTAQYRRLERRSCMEFMQFTGVVAQDRTEVFEGDIVNHDNSCYPCQIVYKEKTARFMAKEMKGLRHLYEVSNKKIIAIKGNIYQE